MPGTSLVIIGDILPGTTQIEESFLDQIQRQVE